MGDLHRGMSLDDIVHVPQPDGSFVPRKFGDLTMADLKVLSAYHRRKAREHAAEAAAAAAAAAAAVADPSDRRN